MLLLTDHDGSIDHYRRKGGNAHDVDQKVITHGNTDEARAGRSETPVTVRLSSWAFCRSCMRWRACMRASTSLSGLMILTPCERLLPRNTVPPSANCLTGSLRPLA